MYLDSEIRNWILVPIMLIMTSVGVLTHYINALLIPSDTHTVKSQRERCALARSKLLRAHSRVLPATAVDSRRAFLIKKFNDGDYLKVKKDPNTVVNPIEDPSAVSNMKDMLTKYTASIIPQTFIMTSITFFFSGLIIVRLPFQLTAHYKDMLQRGIETRDMDATWVSSLSWYFLNLFGLKSLYNLVLDGNTNIGGLMEIGEMPTPMGKSQDAEMFFKREVEYLELMRLQEPVAGSEDRVIEMYEGA